MGQVILVAYDISDDERRLRLARALLSMGYSRVQKSVYVYSRGYEGVRRRTVEVAARIIDAREDNVLIITVPEQSYRSAVRLGVARGHGESTLTL